MPERGKERNSAMSKELNLKFEVPGISNFGLRRPNPFRRRGEHDIWVSYNGCGIGNVSTIAQGVNMIREYATARLKEKITENRHQYDSLLNSTSNLERLVRQ